MSEVPILIKLLRDLKDIEVNQLQAEIERLRTTVAEQQSDIAWMRNRIAELDDFIRPLLQAPRNRQRGKANECEMRRQL